MDPAIPSPELMALAQPHGRKPRGRRARYLRLAVSLLLIAVVLYFVDWRELAGALVRINLWYLLPFAILMYADRAMMAYKWNLLLRVAAVRVPFMAVFSTYVVAPVAGVLLPSTIGGDAFRLYSLSRYRVSLQAVLASIMVERLLGFLAMLGLTAVSLGVASWLIRERSEYWAPMGWAMFAAAVITVILMMALIDRRVRGLIDSLAQRFERFWLVRKLHEIYALCAGYRQRWRVVGVVLAWTAVEQTVPIIANVLMVWALDVEMSTWELVAIVPLIVLGTRLPISLDGIGVQEGLYVGLFALVGVSTSEAFLLSVLGRVVPLLCFLPWCVPYVLMRRSAATDCPHATTGVCGPADDVES